jgi:hypothetical protein
MHVQRRPGAMLVSKTLSVPPVDCREAFKPGRVAECLQHGYFGRVIRGVG